MLLDSCARQPAGRAVLPEPSAATRVTLEGTESTDVLERLRGCIQFAVRTLESADRSHPLWDVQLGDVTGYDKLVLEAGLFAVLVHRAGLCRDDVGELIGSVRRNYDSRTVLTTLRRQPVQATTLATVLVVLDRFGLTSAAEREGLESALNSPYVEATERVPFRLLDRRWVLHLAGRRPLVDSCALATSAACRTMHPIYMTREDAYAITHAVMYATDFGASPPPSELMTGGLAETIDACLAWCLYEGDYDLVAELLLSQVLLGGELSEYGEIAWQDCRAVWDDFGFLPSPSLSAKSFTDITDEGERIQYAYHHMYHTMLVAGLLCSALLGANARQQGRAEDAPPSDTTWPSAVRERADVGDAARAVCRHLAHALDLDESSALAVVGEIRWHADESRFDQLLARWSHDSGSGAAVQRMARDAVLTETARAYDLSGLAAALRSAATSGRLTPTAMAGAGFLARQILPNGTPATESAADPSAAATSAGVSAAFAGCLTAIERCWPTSKGGERDDRELDLELGSPTTEEPALA